MSGRKMLLELFSGTGSVGAHWREAGLRVVSVDRDSRYNPEVCEDILTWDYKALETPCFICTLRTIQLRTQDAQNPSQLSAGGCAGGEDDRNHKILFDLKTCSRVVRGKS